MGRKCDGMGEKSLRVKKILKVFFFFNLCQKGCDKQAKSDLQQLTSEYFFSIFFLYAFLRICAKPILTLSAGFNLLCQYRNNNQN